QHVDACLPITALKTFQWRENILVFQGQGPFFRVVDDRTGDVAAQVRVFNRSNVHGFLVLPHQLQTIEKPDHVSVIAWGGCSLRCIDLLLNPSQEVTLRRSSAELQAPDWIMSGCAAVETQPDIAYLVTANNAILRMRLKYGTYANYNSTIQVHQLATSVKSSLFSADLIALSASHVLVTAGTVFGEIIVWSCFLGESGLSQSKAVSSIHHFFTGHDGSIFGVRISPKIPALKNGQPGRILASCSDDRSIRIWDISDCENKTSADPSPYSSDGFELRSTGFREASADDIDESCVAKAYGHAARIWSVIFRPLRSNSSSTVGLVSRGEDCTCFLWNLSWDSSSGATKYQLHQTAKITNHIGKHIWSLDLYGKGDETFIYTGGADGALKCFSVNENAPLSAKAKSPSGSKKKSADPESCKIFAFTAPDCFIGQSLRNELVLGYVGMEESFNVTWETICDSDTLHSVSVITGIPQKGLALVCSTEGMVRLYNHGNKSISNLLHLGCRPLRLIVLDTTPRSEKFSFLASYSPENSSRENQATLVTVSGGDSNFPRADATVFSLPQAPYRIHSASLMHDGRYLVMGSRLGGVAVFETAGLGLSSQPLFDDRRVHGNDTTSQMRTISSTEEDGSTREYLMTCGRDGNYCLHELIVGEDENAVVFLRTIHRVSSALGPHLEGVYMDDSGDLFVYGCRAQSFVLRNETKQTDVISIPSAGARRGWDFQAPTKDKDGLLLWRDGKELHSRRIRTDFNRALHPGGHGREIKTMDTLNTFQGQGPIFVTGSEDTTVRIYRPFNMSSTKPWGHLECLCVLDDHTSGVQQVSWSKDGQYIFTSAAFEEFFVWGVRWIPTFGMATVHLASSPKDDASSDLRITSFDVLEVEEVDNGKAFLFCLAFSNSTIKIFHFSPKRGFRFTLLARGTYMTNCLTQAHLWVNSSSVSLVTAATDGHITFWDLTSTLKPFYTIGFSGLKSKHSFEGFAVSPESITCESRYRLHSNSIKAMELLPLANDSAIILAGSDDNSISVSLLNIASTSSDTSAHLSTVSIPDAHTAGVTTLKALCGQTSPESDATRLKIVTSGNDHRVKVWSVTVDSAENQDTKNIDIELLLDQYSAVADISSLGFLKESGPQTRTDSGVPRDLYGKLILSGVGIEMLDVVLQ
ncbi:hypothetical protein N7462_010151, partial [Penicillium macrosclerotiorum]|uniref:uncharacterized protein n=1 Tax=Penicillium macrosclerotiorum TaxID=303699 RepID=UPI002547D84F